MNKVFELSCESESALGSLCHSVIGTHLFILCSSCKPEVAQHSALLLIETSEAQKNDSGPFSCLVRSCCSRVLTGHIVGCELQSRSLPQFVYNESVCLCVNLCVCLSEVFGYDLVHSSCSFSSEHFLQAVPNTAHSPSLIGRHLGWRHAGKGGGFNTAAKMETQVVPVWHSLKTLTMTWVKTQFSKLEYRGRLCKSVIY